MASNECWFGMRWQSGSGRFALAHRGVFLRFWAIVLMLLSWPLCATAAPKWKVLETPRFTVVSQISEKETRAWAEEYNQFIDALKGVLSVDERFLPRLTVVLFAREKDFGVYRPIGENGKPQDWVAGYFSRQETWSVIGMADRLDDEATRRIIFHEGVHWFVSADQRRFPMWFNEGLAEVFSTFTFHNQEVKWGQPIDFRVISLRRQKLLPLSQLLMVSQSDKMFNESDRTGLFYSESWAFMHYLVFGRRKGGQGSVNEYLSAYFSGMSTEGAFQKTFGMDFATMDLALEAYLRGGEYHVYSPPASPTAKITAPFEPAAPALVQVALAKLAYGSNHRELAKKHAEEAVRLDPVYAPGYAMLAWVRSTEESPDEFFEAADKAVKLGAQDADALWLLAMARYKKAWALGGVPTAEAREIANLLERAINLFPAQKSAYLNLGSILAQIDRPDEDDALFLEQGRKLFPDEKMLLVGQAQLLRKKGDKEKSLKLLQTVLDQPGQVSIKEQEFLKKLKITWDISDTLAQIYILREQKKYNEAVVLLDALFARGTTLESRAMVMQVRREMCALAALQEANAARKDGQKEEAARLYQSVLDMERIPAWLRGQAQQSLQKLHNQSTAATPAEE
ncbi:MAG: DUF1570 domain-containing protein [Verrucomicrobia bacterium]|nr:DUF1570 domain-containing protein [Verrucomicrobiota bacterium]